MKLIKPAWEETINLLLGMLDDRESIDLLNVFSEDHSAAENNGYFCNYDLFTDDYLIMGRWISSKYNLEKGDWKFMEFIETLPEGTLRKVCLRWVDAEIMNHKYSWQSKGSSQESFSGMKKTFFDFDRKLAQEIVDQTNLEVLTHYLYPSILEPKIKRMIKLSPTVSSGSYSIDTKYYISNLVVPKIVELSNSENINFTKSLLKKFKRDSVSNDTYDTLCTVMWLIQQKNKPTTY